jgi:hypothetical protein
MNRHDYPTWTMVGWHLSRSTPLLPAVQAGQPMAEGPELTAVHEARRSAPARDATALGGPEALRLRARSALIGTLAQPAFAREPRPGAGRRGGRTTRRADMDVPPLWSLE